MKGAKPRVDCGAVSAILEHPNLFPLGQAVGNDATCGSGLVRCIAINKAINIPYPYSGHRKTKNSRCIFELPHMTIDPPMYRSFVVSDDPGGKGAWDPPVLLSKVRNKEG